MRHTRLLGRSAAAIALVSIAFGVQASLGAGPSLPSTVTVVDPARILDTRIALGVPTANPVGPKGTIDVQVTGVGGVPANATGVVVTLTGTEATSDTFITAYPTGSTQSTTSVLNVSVGVDIANTVTLSLGTGGKISLFNNGGNVHLVADVSGYLLPATTAPATTPPTTPTTPTPHIETTTIELNAFTATGIGLGAPSLDGCVDLGASGEAYMDVPLPDGAAPTKFAFRYYDTAPSFQTFVVHEIDQQPFSPPTPGSTLVDSQNQSQGTSGYGVTTITPAGADAVSPTVRYQVTALNNGVTAGTFQKFCGLSVTYDRLVP